ncbi:TetR family transcriptional regulator C-terminal domain-containing protein [Novosphingobium profundi]|uniref:TetR/AcrR family transcriptional regulator n=1 Tax=Novosphingobium profundi TaxID=1774954 RepID=UPI001BDB670B|nr:TetR family transcriptional regulator C-terminal domain-containing protein [Novosphingobium profundi]MBT0668268.1 TetR family transcriptional regulator C-terminal domain-containing protein [Novosphingobium profundi]
MSTRSNKSQQEAVPRPRRTLKRQQPGVRRQDLLQVTLGCLARLGPRGTTGREICRQAGVSHGLLRHYFSNPQNLLFETYEELCDQVVVRLGDELAKPAPSPWAALDAFFETLFSQEWANTELLGAWLAFWSLVRNNPEFAQKNDSFNREVRTLLTGAMERLPATSGAMPIEDAVAIMTATMDGLWFEYCLSPDRLPRDHAIALCSRTLRRLIPEAV